MRNSKEMIDELRRYVKVDPYPFVIDIERSKGMYLCTVEGKMIFDWAGYYGAKLLGHNHPGLDDPAYVKRLVRAANNKTANPDFLTPECLDYYRLLYENAPVCMRGPELEVYVVNSGAEAVENMMKYLLVLHSEKKGLTGGTTALRRFIYFNSAFHGRTVFALNITRLQHAPVVTKGFQGIVQGNIEVTFPHVDTSQSAEWNDQRTNQALQDIEESLNRYAGEIVGIVIEPLQGAGGHRIAQIRFFQELSRLAHRYGTYLCFDEVQTAGGQTGKLFMCDHFDLPHAPQAVAVAKKFGNGAVYMLETLGDRGVLDSTWGGNLADMVRVCREFEIVRNEQLIEKVPEKAAVLISGLEALAQKYPNVIFNIRGIGLYQGFSLRRATDRARLLSIALNEHDLLLLEAGVQSVRFRPMIDVTEQEIYSMLDILDKCIAKL